MSAWGFFRKFGILFGILLVFSFFLENTGFFALSFLHFYKIRLINYRLLKNVKGYQSDIISHYYDDIQLYPFHKVELLRLIDELEIEGDAVRKALTTSFKRANDTGIMTENEAADFVIFELNGENEKSQELAAKLANLKIIAIIV